MVLRRWGVLLAFLALELGGCSGKSRVEEEDRQGIDVAFQIDKLEDAELDRVEVFLHDQPELRAKFGPVVDRMRTANDDRAAIHARLLDNFGPPKVAISYKHESIGDLLERMRKAHAVTFWASVAGVLMAGGAVALGIARSPLAKMIPGFGPVFQLADGLIEGGERFMARMKADGKPDVAAALAEELEAVQQDKRIQPYAEKFLDRVKGKLAAQEPPQGPPGAPPAAEAATTA